MKNWNINIKGIKSYSNTDLCKSLIYKDKDNWEKSGIYCWTNLISDKGYVGSAKSLSSRLSTYYSLNTINEKLKKGSSIIEAAIFLNVKRNTIRKIFDEGIFYHGLMFEFETKDLRIWVCNLKGELLEVLESAKKTSRIYNIPFTTIQRYIKSGKLYKNKFYFYNVNSYKND